MPYRLKPPSHVACWLSLAFTLLLLVVLLIEVATGACPPWAHAARFGLAGGLVVANAVPLLLHRQSVAARPGGDDEPDRPEPPRLRLHG